MPYVFSHHLLLMDGFAPFIRVHGHLSWTNDYRLSLITHHSSPGIAAAAAANSASPSAAIASLSAAASIHDIFDSTRPLQKIHRMSVTQTPLYSISRRVTFTLLTIHNWLCRDAPARRIMIITTTTTPLTVCQQRKAAHHGRRTQSPQSRTVTPRP